jgi:hypothetical protein
MPLKPSLRLAALTFALTVSASAALAEDDAYYFYVKNASNMDIVKLQVSVDKVKWGAFQLDEGIVADTTSKLVWDESTNDEDCEQWIRAQFADGSMSEAAKYDFCNDLDDPIIMSPK